MRSPDEGITVSPGNNEICVIFPNCHDTTVVLMGIISPIQHCNHPSEDAEPENRCVIIGCFMKESVGLLLAIENFTGWHDNDI